MKVIKNNQENVMKHLLDTYLGNLVCVVDLYVERRVWCGVGDVISMVVEESVEDVEGVIGVVGVVEQDQGQDHDQDQDQAKELG